MIVLSLYIIKTVYLYKFLSQNKAENICDPGAQNQSLSRWGMFVAIARNKMYGLKLLIYLLCQKSLGY